MIKSFKNFFIKLWCKTKYVKYLNKLLEDEVIKDYKIQSEMIYNNQYLCKISIDIKGNIVIISSANHKKFKCMLIYSLTKYWKYFDYGWLK